MRQGVTLFHAPLLPLQTSMYISLLTLMILTAELSLYQSSRERFVESISIPSIVIFGLVLSSLLKRCCI